MLAMRYGRPLLSSTCDGCGAPFSLEHVLDCNREGLVTQRHNEVRDAVGDIVAKRCGGGEPVLREADEIRGIFALIAD